MEPSSGFGLRPRSIGEILDLVFRIYRKRFRQFASVGLVLSFVQFLRVLLCYLERLSMLPAMERSFVLATKRGPTRLSTEASWVRVVLIGLVVFGIVYALQIAMSSPILILGFLRGVAGTAPQQTIFGP